MAKDVVLLEKGGLAVEVSPLGGAILSARWHGIPILAPTPSPGLDSHRLGREACFPLVPFGNRIEDNGFRFDGRDYRLSPRTADPLVLHGDGWLHRWTIVQQEPNEIVFISARREHQLAFDDRLTLSHRHQQSASACRYKPASVSTMRFSQEMAASSSRVRIPTRGPGA